MEGYKTIIFNILLGLVLLINQLDPTIPLPVESVPLATEGIIQLIAIIGVVGNLILRYFTKTPIAYKK